MKLNKFVNVLAMGKTTYVIKYYSEQVQETVLGLPEALLSCGATSEGDKKC